MGDVDSVRRPDTGPFRPSTDDGLIDAYDTAEIQKDAEADG
jgi:hypothetical protein